MNDQIIRITRALNHPIRIQILYYLNDNKQSSVNNLVKQFDVSQPAISRHLRILEEARLVKSERVKQEKYYRLFDNHIIKILDVLRQHAKGEF
ncbi:ArsR/SmtB family transcription factor [Lactobacillus intestinalis]|uniref:ArsR/SmtB family transcription factor n=1 Tax=Lactobacillus intestinalis TaxID=151781 RepID=UPI001F561A02|nr:metalloregulator ArsR/SmtB family transcription factor [Lactobacillus intestinalis]